MTRALITITVSSSEDGGETNNHHHHLHHHHLPMVVDCFPESSRIDDMSQRGESVSTHVKLGMPAHLMTTAYPQYGFDSFESRKTHPPSRRSRTVAFAEKVMVKEIPLWTVAETSNVWWTREEIRHIRRDYSAIVQRIMNGEQFSPQDEQFCTRGLEARTKSGAKQRHLLKQRARLAVIKAQAFQQAEGFRDPQYMAEVYHECSQSCANAAHVRGMSDECAAKQS